METSASFEAWSAPSSYPAIEPTSEAREAKLKAGNTTRVSEVSMHVSGAYLRTDLWTN